MPPAAGGDPCADYRAASYACTDLVDLADRRFGAPVVIRGLVVETAHFLRTRPPSPEQLLPPG